MRQELDSCSDSEDESVVEELNRPRTRLVAFDEDDEGRSLSVLYDVAKSLEDSRDGEQRNAQSPKGKKNKRRSTKGSATPSPSPAKRKRKKGGGSGAAASVEREGSGGNGKIVKRRRTKKQLLGSGDGGGTGKGSSRFGIKQDVERKKYKRRKARYLNAQTSRASFRPIQKSVLSSISRSNMSLQLLDFYRRQQYSKTRTDDAPREFEAVLPDYDNLGAWESLPEDTVDDRTREFTSFNFPRIDATNTPVYARTISRLAHFISGRGRQFVYYEHFYSDIDKPFYDYSPLLSFMSSVSLCVSKLTRREWGLVKSAALNAGRGAFKRSRRLFSAKFVSEQLEELREYREQVRSLAISC